MSGFGCCFWWLVFGALLGWLASWLFGRMFAKTEEEVAPVMAAPTRVSADGIDYAAARAAGYVLTGPENLEIIEGIGPSIAHLLRSSGVNTFAPALATGPTENERSRITSTAVVHSAIGKCTSR